jgi:DNA-binding MarR family transcriptional regulator
LGEPFTDNKIPFGRLVRMISHQLRRQNALPEGDSGLTSIQQHMLNFILLETLHRDLYQKDIEEEFQIRKSTATGSLQLLEKKGLISRENDKNDARLKRIVPTKEAEALRPGLLKVINQREARLLAGIPKDELRICFKVLYQVLDNVTKAQPANTSQEKENMP